MVAGYTERYNGERGGVMEEANLCVGFTTSELDSANHNQDAEQAFLEQTCLIQSDSVRIASTMEKMFKSTLLNTHNYSCYDLKSQLLLISLPQITYD